MSVPQEFNISNLSGIFTMNKTLSDSADDILRLQGISWLKRRGIGLATVTLSITHYMDEDGVEHININQTLTGGIPGTTEQRTLNWEERSSKDHIFGAVIAKARRVKADELDVEWLKKDWTEETYVLGLIQTCAESDTGKSGTAWKSNQTWGIEIVNEQRRYVRRVRFIGPGDEDIQAKFVYDYNGPNK